MLWCSGWNRAVTRQKRYLEIRSKGKALDLDVLDGKPETEVISMTANPILDSVDAQFEGFYQASWMLYTKFVGIFQS